jgi:hypothetical protein
VINYEIACGIHRNYISFADLPNFAVDIFIWDACYLQKFAEDLSAVEAMSAND